MFFFFHFSSGYFISWKSVHKNKKNYFMLFIHAYWFIQLHLHNNNNNHNNKQKKILKTNEIYSRLYYFCVKWTRHSNIHTYMIRTYLGTYRHFIFCVAQSILLTVTNINLSLRMETLKKRTNQKLYLFFACTLGARLQHCRLECERKKKRKVQNKPNREVDIHFL